MRKTGFLVVLFFAFAISQRSVLAQGFPYHLYEPRTLSELVDAHSSSKQVEGSTNLIISAEPFYSAIRLEYAGQSRKISQARMGLFKLWIESLKIKANQNKDPMSLIDKEFLFTECGKDYWIPVQTPAANDFPRTLKKGDRLTLYLMFVGGIGDKDKWDIVFFTNSFRIYE